ncbi:latrophilin-like protein LAT-2 isoform X2 [Eurytemora carolleeae]|nr:latrophilin-like protein LAT-2 isoform X2 [Eurytemora carolleeae]|eukprot:XP_023324873.1 latrophilin-like protein LAT-2 isoform X2 [Eurytemora affinis]
MLLINSVVTVVALKVSHNPRRRSNEESRVRLLSMLKNVILLSVILGLTWSIGLFGSSLPQQFIFVILNASTGVFIFFLSVLLNPQVMAELKKNLRAIRCCTRTKNETNESKLPIKFFESHFGR